MAEKICQIGRDIRQTIARLQSYIAYTISEEGIRFLDPDYDRVGTGSKVNQFVHVQTSVDTQHFIQIHARVVE